MPGPAPAVPDPTLADLLRDLTPRSGITASLLVDRATWIAAAVAAGAAVAAVALTMKTEER